MRVSHLDLNIIIAITLTLNELRCQYNLTRDSKHTNKKLEFYYAVQYGFAKYFIIPNMHQEFKLLVHYYSKLHIRSAKGINRMRNQAKQQAVANKSVFISCVIPAHNEGLLIKDFLLALVQHIQKLTNIYEIIVIDDGSTDNTVAQILTTTANPNIKLISLSRNFGKEAALTAGIDHATGDIAILLDADFQHPITMIKDFLHAWADGYDMVYGIRNNRNAESAIKRNFTRLFYWCMAKISRIDIPPNSGDFRLIDRKIINALQLLPEKSRLMKGLYAWVGYKRLGLPFEVQNRTKGKSNFNLCRLFELAAIGITSFSDIPLRIWSIIGLLISCGALIYATYITAVTIFYGTDLPGFPSLITAIMFLGGVQLLSIGILGEYVARIFTEVKQRPIYLIAAKHGFTANETSPLD